MYIVAMRLHPSPRRASVFVTAVLTLFASSVHAQSTLRDRIRVVAEEEAIPVATAFALIEIESAFDTAAVGRGGPLGLMQLLPGTASSILPGITRKDLFNPETNVRIGLRYLRQLMERYDGDLELALRAYKNGPRAVDAGGGKSASSNSYIKRFFAARARYETPPVG